MNWLAHLAVAPREPLLRLGNLAGDFVRGVDLSLLHADLQRGIAMHRAIDRFVDAHPAVHAAKGRLQPPFRRFGGVLVDVWFDHVLARDWHRLGDGRPLAAFAADVHGDLRAHAALLPPELRAAIPSFESGGWLVDYATVGGIARVLGAMARRVARPTPLADGTAPLRASYAALGADFERLWPDLTRFAATL